MLAKTNPPNRFKELDTSIVAKELVALEVADNNLAKVVLVSKLEVLEVYTMEFEACIKVQEAYITAVEASNIGVAEWEVNKSIDSSNTMELIVANQSLAKHKEVELHTVATSQIPHVQPVFQHPKLTNCHMGYIQDGLVYLYSFFQFL